jgi:hypothetical protein
MQSDSWGYLSGQWSLVSKYGQRHLVPSLCQQVGQSQRDSLNAPCSKALQYK